MSTNRHIIILPVDANNPRGATTIYVGAVHSVHKSRKEAQAEFERLHAEGIPEPASSPADQYAKGQSLAGAVVVICLIVGWVWFQWLGPLLQRWGWL